MNRTVPLSEIDNFEQIAVDLSTLLPLEENADIAKEFPDTVERYAGDGNIDAVVNNLETAKQRYKSRVREQFIAFAGERAVGIALVATGLDEPPRGVDPSWPNLSYLVCHPYRRQGLGRLLVAACMEVVEKNFGNCAWTYVKPDNTPSVRLLENAGFRPSGWGEGEWAGYRVYLFEGNAAQS